MDSPIVSERNRGFEPGTEPTSALDAQRAAEGLDPVPEPAQTRASSRIGTADTVVRDRDLEQTVGRCDSNRDP